MGKIQLSRGRVVGGQNAQDLSPAVVRTVNEKFVYDKFRSRPIVYNEDGIGDPTGATGNENGMLTEVAAYEYHVLGTQTILGPVYHASKGLDLVQDEVSGDGNELTLGIGANSRGTFIVGTDGDFYFKARLEFEDVSGIAEAAVGFRKMEAYQAAIDNYDEMAAFNVQAGVVNIETILNGGTTDTTDTTETDIIDDGVHTFEVRVSSAGVVTFAYDDAEPTVTAAFTFDDAEVVIPFVYQTLGATAANGLFISEWQSGLGKRSV
jgi:hypothetical protein